jgi:hypothetical protein
MVSSEPPANSVPPIEPAPVLAPPVPVVPPVFLAPAVPGTPSLVPYPAPQPYPPAPPGYGGQPGQPYVGYYTPQPQRGLATASMVTGIAGVFFALFEGFGFLPSLAAVITGHLARKRQPYARGMWLTGLICGYIGLGISLIWIVVLIVIAVAAISAGVAGGLNSSY